MLLQVFPRDLELRNKYRKWMDGWMASFHPLATTVLASSLSSLFLSLSVTFSPSSTEDRDDCLEVVKAGESGRRQTDSDQQNCKQHQTCAQLSCQYCIQITWFIKILKLQHLYLCF